MFLLDSDKQSFRVDNVPKFIKIKAAIIKMQCFKKYRVFFLYFKREYVHDKDNSNSNGNDNDNDNDN